MRPILAGWLCLTLCCLAVCGCRDNRAAARKKMADVKQPVPQPQPVPPDVQVQAVEGKADKGAKKKDDPKDKPPPRKEEPPQPVKEVAKDEAAGKVPGAWTVEVK